MRSATGRTPIFICGGASQPAGPGSRRRGGEPLEETGGELGLDRPAQGRQPLGARKADPVHERRRRDVDAGRAGVGDVEIDAGAAAAAGEVAYEPLEVEAGLLGG